MRRLPAGLLLSLLALAACGDEPTAGITGPDAPSMVISDASHGTGNPHFYFKAPMVPATTYGGTFDPTLDVVVKICEWSLPTGCGTEIAEFTMNSGAGSETVRMDRAEEHYNVNWHTGRFALDDTRTYRIRVLVGGHELGHADVDLYRSQKETKKLNAGELVAWKYGATLPIKFRIELGALPGEEPSSMGELISGGVDHTCALGVDGSAWCWGANWNGELGTGGAYLLGNSQQYHHTPQPVAGGHRFTSISAGLRHTCALKQDGGAWCWGNGTTGNLGNGTNAFAQPSPAQVSGGHRFVELDVTAQHACGRTTGGTLWCWGFNGYGQLGDGSTVHRNTPVQVSGTYRSVSAGEHHTCAIGADGVTYCWGLNFSGEIGNGLSGYRSGDTPYYEVTPQPVSSDFAEVEAGWSHTCALTASGAASCWGSNLRGQLGRGTFASSTPYAGPTPAAVVGSHSFSKLVLGGHHSCGLKADGSALCWGMNQVGQLGTGATTAGSPYGFASPQPLPGTWAALGAGHSHTCGITATGAGRCWGGNGWGQLGTGTVSHANPTPLVIAGGLTFATP